METTTLLTLFIPILSILIILFNIEVLTMIDERNLTTELMKKLVIIKQNKRYFVAFRLRFFFIPVSWVKIGEKHFGYDTIENAEKALSEFNDEIIKDKEREKQRKINNKITVIKTKPETK